MLLFANNSCELYKHIINQRSYSTYKANVINSEGILKLLFNIMDSYTH